MMNLKIVYPLLVSRVNQDGSPYEFTENRFFNQTKLFADYQKVDLGYVAKDDENYYLIPNEAGVEINPEMHGFGNPDINEAYKKTENVSDYTKAYAAFGKDRTLDYSAQIDKDLLDTNTENILGVSLVKVDENYQPQQVMPSVIGSGEQRIPTNNALLKETLDLIRSHIANKSNAHAIESISELSNSLNQLAELISSVNTIANESLGIANTATESANAAGILASQATQAAQEAAGIAESATTIADEAAQAINEHSQATTNPHATNVTQEFADTQITALATQATYTPTVWTYLVGLFTTVPKSVKEHIAKAWTVIENLKNRIAVLEDNVVLNITTTQAITSLSLTHDKNGNTLNLIDFDIIIYGENVDSLNSALMTVNNNSTSMYYNAVTMTTRADILVYLRGQLDKKFEGVLMFRKLTDNYMFHQTTNDTTIGGVSRANNYGGYINTNIGNITRIDLSSINWKSGTKIKIVKR